jgi:membrane associated rhomboid family serine protease/Tfp pilus assembly protein PilF
MKGRRWPVITISLIAINFLAFLGTHWRIQTEDAQVAEVRAHILLLAAMHPELNETSEEQELVNRLREKYPDVWKRLALPSREVADQWDVRVRMMEDPGDLQHEMDLLGQQYAAIQQESVLQRYAFVPAHPAPISYLTANFLHIGWLHIIGNMWFLWLAGVILEDTWGRVIYPIFYFLSGIIAMQFHAWTDPTSLAATLGASGAVAALMGAFLVRFPQTKIQMRWIFGFGIRSYRFKAKAYWLLPLWLGMEIFSGSIFGASSGVAHWAHVGGFVFGAAGALGLRYCGLEHVANQAIESKVTWTADSAIVQATEKMDQGKLDEAIAGLQTHIVAKPASLESYVLLALLYWRKNDIPKYHQAIIRLCQLHLKAKDLDAAWQDFGEYLNSGGERMPVSTWLELARAAEGQQNYERAVEEYDKLAQAYPAEKQSLLALMAAGRLSISKLGRPAEALRFFRAAATSPVPHLDWETNIQGGIREAEKAISSGSLEPAVKP